MQLARAQAIQVYDRICDFEGVKGSSEIQQKMTLGMSQIPTEMSMVFFHRSLSSSVVFFVFLLFDCGHTFQWHNVLFSYHCFDQFVYFVVM